VNLRSHLFIITYRLKLRSFTPNPYSIPQLYTHKKNSNKKRVNLDRERGAYKLGIDDVVGMSSCRHLRKTEQEQEAKNKIEKWRRDRDRRGKGKRET
jgi:hypothetical protein